MSVKMVISGNLLAATKYARNAWQVAILAKMEPPVTPVQMVITMLAWAYAHSAAQTAMLVVTA